MSKRQKARRIVIRERDRDDEPIEYRWEVRGPEDYDYNSTGLSVNIVTPPPGWKAKSKQQQQSTGREARFPKNPLWIDLTTTTLILPSYVRRLILEARAAGWEPYAKSTPPRGFRYQPKQLGPYPDEPKKRSSHADERSPLNLDRIEAILLEADLLEAIRDSDDDDLGPRVVYADWLLQRGDLRGEYINLACKEPRSAEEDARMKALFSEHEWTWLGPIGDVTGARRWRLGVVEDVRLDRRARGVVEPAIGHLHWLAVRRVDARATYLAPSDVVKLVSDPVMRNIDALAITVEPLDELIKLDAVPDVEELTITWSRGGGLRAIVPLIPELLDTQDRPRRLRRLLMPEDGDTHDHLLTQITDPNLELTLVTSFESLSAWQRSLDRLQTAGETALRTLHLVRGLTVMFEPIAFTATLRYEEQTGRFSRLDLTWTAANDPYARAQLQEALESIESNALRVISANGPNIERVALGEWFSGLRYSARNQQAVIFEGRLLTE